MIIVDLINDEALLFIEAFKKLIDTSALESKNIDWVTEGNRWAKETTGLQLLNRLKFFDELDEKQIDLESELSRLSREYDNFNIYACDRYLTQLDRQMQVKLLVYTFLFYEKIFESGKTTHYFTTGIAYTYNLVSFQVARKRNIKHISFYGTRYDNRTAISLDIKNTFNEVDKHYQNYSFDKVSPKMYGRVKGFINRPIQPAYMKNAINASSIKGVFIKEFFIRANQYYFSNKHKYDFFTRSPLELSRFKLNKILQAKKINAFHNNVFDKPNYKDRYFIFPLHMQPEASTLILSPFYVDQKTTIINISKCLPLDTIIYVKEHKSALGQHSLGFYKDLKKYANIKLISYRENMFDLIKHSLGTINLSSTVGFESLFLKKPAVVLGDVFYNSTGLVFKVDSFKELNEVLEKVSKEGFDVDNEFDEYDARFAFYLDSLINASYPFEFNVAKLDTKKRVLKGENIDEFKKCLFRLINKQKK